MNGRNTIARILVALGAVGWFATAVFHLKDYPEDTAKLSALSVPLQAGFRTIFLMVGWDWIVVALVALLAAFTETTLRKMLVLFCGVAGLVQAALALALMGVFPGTELMFPAAILIVFGGVMFRSGGTNNPPTSATPPAPTTTAPTSPSSPTTTGEPTDYLVSAATCSNKLRVA